MTSDVVATALAGLGPMMMQNQRKPVNRFAGRRQYGDALLMQGSRYAPLQGGVAEGLARAGQAVLGGWMAGKADRDEIADEETKSKALVEAIAKAQTRNPDGTTSFDFSPVTQALAARGDGGLAAYMALMNQLSQRQQGQGAARVGAMLGDAPPGGAPGGGAPPGAMPPQGGGQPQAGGVFDVPPEYQGQVADLAKRYNLPPQLIASTIWNESRWNPGAVNPGDQRGSMNPATGKPYDSVGIGQWGEQWAKARGFDPRDPKASLQHTAMAMRELADRYGGNILLGRLAYGWGPGNVDQWLKAGGDPNKLPDGARVWLPRTALGISDDAQARAAFPQIVQYLRPGAQFGYGGQGQVTQGQPPAPAMPPPQAAAPPAQPPQAPQVVADGQYGAQGADTPQGGLTGAGLTVAPTVQLPTGAGKDDGAEYEKAARGLERIDPDLAKQMAAKALAAREEQRKREAARAEKAPPDTALTPRGGVGVVEGAEDAKRRLATADAQGKRSWAPATRGGRPGQIDTITGEFKYDDAAFNEGQSKSAGFADRQLHSQKVLDVLENMGLSGKGAFLEHVPIAGNYAQHPDYQRYVQARDNFIAAQLRKESGAAIGEKEYADAYRIYMPRPGDSADVMRQKKEVRDLLLQGMTRDAGGAYQPPVIKEQPPPTGDLPQPRGAAPATRDGLPVIDSPDKARALPPGTEFMTPDGRRMRVPGGR